MPANGPSKSREQRLDSIVPAIVVLCALLLVAQPAPGQSAPKYDVQTETKMNGTVDDVRLPSSAKEIVYLLMKTDAATTVEVYLCPKSFLEDMGVSFAKGDPISLSGSKVKQGEADLILAREVVKKGDTLVLRDGKGKPVWN